MSLLSDPDSLLKLFSWHELESVQGMNELLPGIANKSIAEEHWEAPNTVTHNIEGNADEAHHLNHVEDRKIRLK